MRKINSFTFITLNGYYKDNDSDISWHNHGAEENKFSEEQLQQDNLLLFGRTTYELMHSFWPTQSAKDMYPKVAERMNNADKIVISNSMQHAAWKNTTILGGDIIEHIKKLKSTKGKNLTILGSGSIVHLLTDAGLIDEYTIMIDPLALGAGTTLFSGIKNKLALELADIRTFKSSGIVVLTYRKNAN